MANNLSEQSAAKLEQTAAMVGKLPEGVQMEVLNVIGQNVTAFAAGYRAAIKNGKAS